MTSRAPRLSAVYTGDSRDGARLSSSVSGPLDDRGAGSYSVSAAHNGRSNANSADASVGYNFPQGSVSASVGQGRGYRQASLSANGAMLVHGGGVTLAQTMGETVALVHAKDAEGMRVGYGVNRVDGSGYAVVGSLSPYRLNSVDVDPADLPVDIELKTSSLNIAPRAGAIIKLVYPTLRARQVLILSKLADGAPLPFGAEAIDPQTRMAVGAVGQGSRIVMRAESDQGSVRIEWGPGQGESCHIDYELPARHTRGDSAYDILELECVQDQPGPVQQGGVGPLSLR
ncbi:fimbria/pilus outer membrane usher protein [Achromobacter spanius]|nr:fimbria/pilus outer membrane usher protein [Achromobacter spanius]